MPKKGEIATEQWRHNWFNETRHLGYPKITVDDVEGDETRDARQRNRFYLGIRPGVGVGGQQRSYSVELVRTLWKPRRRVKGQTLKEHAKRLSYAGKRQRNRRKDLRSKGGNVQVMRAANAFVGKTENNNRAPWLDALARKYVGQWMVGQPWCGLFCIVAWAKAGKKLPQGVVYTPNIVAWARKGQHFKAVPASAAQPGDLVVFNFPGGSGVADHVGLARGPARNGSIPTVEGNTSPGSGGSQANGGGVYNRVRPVGLIAVVARPK